MFNMTDIPNFKDSAYELEITKKGISRKSVCSRIKVNSIFNDNLGHDKDRDKHISVGDSKSGYVIFNNPSYILTRKFEVEHNLTQSTIISDNECPVFSMITYLTQYEYQRLQISEKTKLLYNLTNTPLSIPSSQN